MANDDDSPGLKRPDHIGRLASGAFCLIAQYPLDTQIILRIPPRSRTASVSHETSELVELLNEHEWHVRSSDDGHIRLTFEPDPLSKIFIDSPNATWNSLTTVMPTEWFTDLIAPVAGVAPRTRARLRLFDGGVAILALEIHYEVDLAAGRAGDLPSLIASALDPVRDDPGDRLTKRCRRLLISFAHNLRLAVTGSLAGEEASPRYAAFVERIRSETVFEVYPTIITKIWCHEPSPEHFDLAGSDLTRVMYLDRSEIVNALPSFEEDFIAVGYDSVWWLVAPDSTTRTDRFPERIELALQYVLALSMLVYVVDIEIDRQLSEITRSRWRDGADNEVLSFHVAQLRLLRSEVADLLKDLSLESFSTWVSDIFLFRRLIAAWLVGESSKALREKLDTANQILREVHEAVVEREQRELTFTGTIFAAASVASLIVAAVTLFFTQTPWEQADRLTGGVMLVGKVILIAYLLSLPAILLAIVPRWGGRILHAIRRIVDRDRGNATR